MFTSELRATLADSGLDAEAIDNAIAKAVASGRATDDSVSDDDILQKAQALADADLDVDDDVPDLFDITDDDTDAFAKGAESMLTIAERVGQGADAAVEAIFKSNATLAGAQREVAGVVNVLAKAVVGQNATLQMQQAQLDRIEKALAIPQQPRAVTGHVAATPSPLDALPGAVSLTNSEAASHVLALQKSASESGDTARVQSLAYAIRELESSAPVAHVFQSFQIPAPTSRA